MENVLGDVQARSDEHIMQLENQIRYVHLPYADELAPAAVPCPPLFISLLPTTTAEKNG